MRALSLRSRLLLWAGAASAVTLVMVIVLVDVTFRANIRQQLEENLGFARQVADGVRVSQIDAHIADAVNVAVDTRLRAAVATGDPATTAQTLQEVFPYASGRWAAILASDGTVIATTAEAPDLDGLVGEDLMAEALYFDTADLWQVGDELVQVAASAVLFGAAPLAVVVTGRPLGVPQLAALETAVGRPVAVVSAAGATGGPEAAALNGALASLLAGGDAPGDVPRLLDLDGSRFLAASLPLTSNAGASLGSVVILGSYDEALAPSNRLRLVLIGIFVFGLLLAFGVSGAFARGITVPVGRLLRETERLAKDDLDHPIAPVRDDEIGQLAASFEKMRVSLKGARAELVRAERLGAIGKAASAVAHDFTQPLSAIAGAVGLLRMGDTPDDVREKCFTAIDGELDRLQRMKQEIVEFARGESTLDEAVVRIDSFLENTFSALRPQLASRGVVLSVDHGYNGEWLIDSYRLERVLENLVRNAAAAIAGAGRIDIRSFLSGDALVLTVDDDGSGIPPERLEEIFEPFVSFGKKEGTGLGLAIARNVVQQHGGTIAVRSSSEGTRFTITLPRREPRPDVPSSAVEISRA